MPKKTDTGLFDHVGSHRFIVHQKYIIIISYTVNISLSQYKFTKKMKLFEYEYLPVNFNFKMSIKTVF